MKKEDIKNRNKNKDDISINSEVVKMCLCALFYKKIFGFHLALDSQNFPYHISFSYHVEKKKYQSLWWSK